MRPLENPAEATVSALVTMRRPDGLSTAGAPMVRPDMVTVTATFGGTVAVPVVITIAVAAGVDAAPVAPPLSATEGMLDVAKNAAG